MLQAWYDVLHVICMCMAMQTYTGIVHTQGKTLDEVVEEMQAGMIIKRMGSVEEVAAAVAFIASSEASFITGTTLLVDGGYTAL